MVEKLVDYFSNGNKAAFAKQLGVSPQTVHSWIARNTFDSELVFAKCDGLSADWLLTGEGPMLRSEDGIRFEETIQRAPVRLHRISGKSRDTVVSDRKSVV